ncbi:MAG: AtpZ/AtpI family protein [Nocardioidaceae bacterium]
MSDDFQPDLSARDLLGLGGLIAACVVLGLVVGLLVDTWLGTTPVFILVGIAVGVLAAAIGVWFRLRPYLQIDE